MDWRYDLVSLPVRMVHPCQWSGVERGREILRARADPHDAVHRDLECPPAYGRVLFLFYVAAGEYGENIRVEGKTIHLLGGCAGGAPADYAGGSGGDFTTRDPRTHVSHIRGDDSAAAAALIDVDGGSLDGFRITGGTGSGDEYRIQGGGVYVFGGSPTISSNTIENNDARHPEISNATWRVSVSHSDLRLM